METETSPDAPTPTQRAPPEAVPAAPASLGAKPSSLLVSVRIPRASLPAADSPATSWSAAMTDASSSSCSEGAHSPGRIILGKRVGATAEHNVKRALPKTTYAARKEAKRELERQIVLLQEQADRLRRQVGVPTLAESQALAHASTQNQTMRQTMETQRLAHAGLRSLLASQMYSHQWSPISTYIHLNKDMNKRRATLSEMRGQKLDFGRRFLTERFQFIDLSRPYDVTERGFADSGDYHFSRCDVVHFEGTRSVKRVFDALENYLYNQEITISEKLDNLTLREDISSMGSNLSNHRLLTYNKSGTMLEKNAVAFSHYYKSVDGQEFAVMISDSVDTDELFPYAPSERVRKDVSTVMALQTVKRKRSQPDEEWSAASLLDAAEDDGEEDDEYMVVAKRCSYVTVHRPQCRVPRATLHHIQENISAWSDVMNKALRDALHSA